MAVLEVPLLLETGGEKRVDVVVVVSAPADVQRERVMQRPGMTLEKLEQMLARQMPDAEKRARADFVVDTGGTFADTDAQVDKIVESLKGRAGHGLRPSSGRESHSPAAERGDWATIASARVSHREDGNAARDRHRHRDDGARPRQAATG